MTITVLPARNEYTSTSSQTVFNYTFKIFANTDLNVYITPTGQEANDATDLTTAYTVDAGTIGDEDGGFLTMDLGVTAGFLVTIVSDVPESRTTDYQFNGDFIPDTVNDDFDRVVQLTKQVEDTAGRTLTFQQSQQAATALTLPEPKATLFMRWNQSETGLENVDLTTFGTPTNASVITYDPPFPSATSSTVEDKFAVEISVLDFGADPTGTFDSTTAIQAAHDASVASEFENVIFPAGVYLFSALTWSPHVGARTVGKVYLETALASGRCIQISDEYGLPARHGLNAARNDCWDGQFYLLNTNAGNTAIAWSFGGATAANFCPLISMKGIETRVFKGGCHEFRFNAFGIDFYNHFEFGGAGNRIIVTSGITNVVTEVNYYSCRWGTGTGYLFGIDNAAGIVFNMHGCEAVFLDGIIEPGNTSNLTYIYFSGGNLEWTTVAAPYIDNDTGATIVFEGTRIVPSATSGWPTPVISQTQGASTTSFTNVKYVFPNASMPVQHDYTDAASRGTLDYELNDQGGNNLLTELFTANASAIVGRAGILITEIQGDNVVWSGTKGNAEESMSVTRVGKEVSVKIRFKWGSTTSHGVATQVFTLPIFANSQNGSIGSWWMIHSTAATYGGVVRLDRGANTITLYTSAVPSLAVSDTVPVTFNTNSQMEIHISYQAA